MASAVLGSLYAHPHDDTPEQICARVSVLEVSATEIAEALEALRLDGLVRSAGSHWQLTAAGYRDRHRVAARTP